MGAVDIYSSTGVYWRCDTKSNNTKDGIEPQHDETNKMNCAPSPSGVTAYIVVYRDARKIWGGFFDSNYKYGCGILAKIINMGLKFVILKLKSIDLGVKFD